MTIPKDLRRKGETIQRIIPITKSSGEKGFFSSTNGEKKHQEGKCERKVE